MKKRKAAIVSCLVILFSLAFFSEIIAAPAKNLNVSLREKLIRDLSSSGLKLVFNMGISNRESSDRLLVSYNYRVLVNQREFFNHSVELDEPIIVPAGSEIFIGLPVKITYSYLFTAVGELPAAGVCDVNGELFFRDERNREDKISFSASGDFPVFKEPDIILLPLKINNLTVGGADFAFSVKLKNVNSYALLIDRLEYELKISGILVAAGSFPGDKSLTENSEKTLSLPVLLDFFESGQDLREILGHDEIPCRFSGVIGIESVWGRLSFPFDVNAGLTVDKSVK